MTAIPRRGDRPPARIEVLVLGGGYGGVTTAAGLGHRADVTVVSEGNTVLFTPMLAEVAAADLDPRHIVSPIRHLCPHAHLVLGTVEAIDVGARTVRVRSPFASAPHELAADVLVLALGSVPATFGIPGVENRALPFKSITDALRIRNRMIVLLETAAETGNASLTTVAVVGAGYSGAELAASMADFLSSAADRFYPTAPRPSVILVDAVDRVVPTLPDRLGAAAMRALRGRGIEVVLGRPVAEVTEFGLELAGGRSIEAGTVVWAAGVAPHPLVEGLDLPHDERGRLVVDEHLCAAPGVYALGDTASVPDGHGGVSPPTAQFALRQGRHLGRHLDDHAMGRRTPGFSYRSKGQLVSLGHRNAVGLVLGIPVSGALAWFLWRTYYLLRLPTLLRKARVAADWTLDLLFPPDVAWLPSSDLGPGNTRRD